MNVHRKRLTVKMIFDHHISSTKWRIRENEFVFSKLSDCVVYPIINALDDDTLHLYSKSDLEMDMMLLCDHNSSSDSSSSKDYPVESVT